MLIVPGQAGEIGVLARHAPLVATLKAGSTRVHLGGNEVLEFATGPGFFKVETDRALALVDDASTCKEIDDERATAQLEAAKAELEKLDAGHRRRRPLAARAAHPPRREPARRFGPRWSRSPNRLVAGEARLARVWGSGAVAAQPRAALVDRPLLGSRPLDLVEERGHALEGIRRAVAAGLDLRHDDRVGIPRPLACARPRRRRR